MNFIERVTAENALVFKDVRLRALKEFPTAFSSTFAKESQISDEEWIQRAVRWSSDGAVGDFLRMKRIACAAWCSALRVSTIGDKGTSYRCGSIRSFGSPAWEGC